MSRPEGHPGAPRQGLRQLATRAALRTLRRRPGFFFRNLRQGPEFLRDRRLQTGSAPYRHMARPEAAAAATVLGVQPAVYERAVAELWVPEPDPNEPLSVWNAREELLRVVGAIVRVSRPRVMIETGVALGFTSATVLRAMADAGRGRLYSIDLPALQYDPDRPVGDAVPSELQDRWDLRLGDSRVLLAPLAAELAPVDVFLHDALHTYSSQLREYRAVWPYLSSGGVLVSDDVENPAFVEFAGEVGGTPELIISDTRRSPGPDSGSAIGLLRKP